VAAQCGAELKALAEPLEQARSRQAAAAEIGAHCVALSSLRAQIAVLEPQLAPLMAAAEAAAASAEAAEAARDVALSAEASLKTVQNYHNVEAKKPHSDKTLPPDAASDDAHRILLRAMRVAMDAGAWDPAAFEKRLASARAAHEARVRDAGRAEAAANAAARAATAKGTRTVVGSQLREEDVRVEAARKAVTEAAAELDAAYRAAQDRQSIFANVQAVVQQMDSGQLRLLLTQLKTQGENAAREAAEADDQTIAWARAALMRCVLYLPAGTSL